MSNVEGTINVEQVVENLDISRKKKRLEKIRDFRRSEDKTYESNFQKRMDYSRRLIEAENRIKKTGLRETLLKILDGGLWHTTCEGLCKLIIESGAILPNPDIPDSRRWNPKGGEERYPYVRKLGGVSLFDFKDFDPDEYSKRCPSSDWEEFVPYRKRWGSAVWIQIDRNLAQGDLISPYALWKRCEQERATMHKIMPYLEAGYIGEVPVCFFQQVLLVNEDGIIDICEPQF